MQLSTGWGLAKTGQGLDLGWFWLALCLCWRRNFPNSAFVQSRISWPDSDVLVLVSFARRQPLCVRFPPSTLPGFGALALVFRQLFSAMPPEQGVLSGFVMIVLLNRFHQTKHAPYRFIHRLRVNL